MGKARVIGKPDDYDPKQYADSLLPRVAARIQNSPVNTAPIAYRVWALNLALNSWVETTASFLALLWCDYTLAALGCLGNLEQLRPFPTNYPIGGKYTPLDRFIENNSGVSERAFLCALGCPIKNPVSENDFKKLLIDLFPYMYQVTLSLVTDWRNIKIFKDVLSSDCNFEYTT